MVNETVVTVRGRLGDDPELRFTPSGAAVANFSVGTNARRFNKQTNEWEDMPTTWYRCAAWRDMAENVAESLQKGMAVIVTGNLSTREYQNRDGQKGLAVEIDVEGIGPDLRWATAKVSRPPRSGGNGPSSTGGQQSRGPVGGGQQRPPADDPWASPGHANDEPPF